MHSTTGNLFMLSDGAVSWLSKRQSVVALSTSEAEYVALSMAAQEATWLQKLSMELKMPSKPITLLEDNQGAIALTIAHSRTKHIDIRFHSVREAQQDGVIDIQYCPTEEMVADVLTKPILREQCGLMGLGTI